MAKGEDELNRVRDLARVIAVVTGLTKEFKLLIGSLLQTREIELLAPVSKSYTTGQPYDPLRLEQFEALWHEQSCRNTQYQLLIETLYWPLVKREITHNHSSNILLNVIKCEILGPIDDRSMN